MKIKLLVCLLVLLFTLPLTAAPPKGKTSRMATTIDNTTWIDANRILMFVTNHGNFGRDLSDYFGYDYGTFFPYAGDTQPISDGEASAITSPLYAGGLWAGGIDSATGETRVIVAEYNDEYVPGPMVGGTFQTDRPEFRVYKLYRDSLAANPNTDYLEYLQYAVDQGAPVDSTGAPEMIGDQMLWSVFNDANPGQHVNNSGETNPMGLEVKMTTFAYDRQGALGNIIIVRLRVYNKGGNTIQNCFFSCWADPDLGGSGDDLVGCDTLLGLGYCYNANNADQFYADRPPCFGYDFFQGPLRAKTAADTLDDGSPVPDSGRMWGQKYADSLNIGMVSFNKYINGTDPDNFTETYNYMRGLNPDGSPYVYNGDTLLYQKSGNPITGVGDLDTAPDDRRLMQSTGPVTFRPGDSTEIIIGIVVGQGSDRLNSITVMRQLDDFAQKLYESNFNPPNPPAAPIVNVTELPGQIILTWGDTSEVDPGDYEFEGYTIWQGESAAGPWHEIVTYDSINGRNVALIDSTIDLETNVIVPDIKRALSDNGLAYGFSTNTDAINGGPLYDVSEYFFRVTAFSFSYIFNGDPVPNADRFLESQTVLRVRPQAPTAGTVFGDEASDTIAVTHTPETGGSGGTVYPIVTDPWALTGDTYQVTFGVDTQLTPAYTEYDTTVYTDTVFSSDTCSFEYDEEGDSTIYTLCYYVRIDSILVDTIDHADAYSYPTYWRLTDVTTNTVLLDKQFNQSGDNEYKVVDGMMVKVLGPDFGVVHIDEVADASGPLSPPDNVMWSLNSTSDWYVGSDQSSNFARMNWLGLIGTYDWEFRFTAAGSEYYNYRTDAMWPSNAPFEVWNIGINTPEDTTDDVRVQFAIIDDDESGGWTYGDRIYVVEQPYVEPNPDPQVYVWPDDWRIGRIKFNDYSEATTAPAEGTIVRFTTAKINTPVDTFTFVSSPATFTSSEADLESIKAVPNPFYLFDSYDPSPGSKRIAFHHLPETCTIRIYNLGGDLIASVDKDDPSTSIAYWDVLTNQNLPVASGIYVYVVDAPGFGTKVGKMAVFTEAEVLKLY